MNQLTKFFPIAFFLTILSVPAASAQTAVGSVSFANSGSPAAQADFLRGLAQLHNFEYEFAAADFRKAEQTDPDFALAYWGEAMTFNHPLWEQQDLDAARAALHKLGLKPEARIAKARTEREKDYLRAVEVLYGDGEKFDRDFRYADFMRGLHEKYPDDIDTTCFYALSILGTSHNGRDIPTYMRAAALLEDVFYANPDHPAAAHYLIHSFDDPIHAILGLRAARAYSAIAPEAGHAQHMTSHIFLALGMWDDVVAANETAIGVVNRQNTTAGKPSLVCGHYPAWLDYAYLQQGRFQDALGILSACRERAVSQPSSMHTHGSSDPDLTAIGSYIQMRAHYIIETQDWNTPALSWPLPPDASLVSQFIFAYSNAFAAARRGDALAARVNLQQMNSFSMRLGPFFDAEKYPADHWYRAVPGILAMQIRALLLASDKKLDRAISQLQKAAELENAMPYAFGPPDIAKPTHELLAELLLQQGRAAEARKAFETARARNPQRVQALFGLWSAQQLLKDSDGAAKTEINLRQIYRHADHELPHPASAGQ